MPAHPQHSASQKHFLGALAASMHEMAQPLSTIQASLELALLCPTTAEQYRWIAEDVLLHLQRAVESMQFTAYLTRFQQPAADIQEVRLSAALNEVISDLQRTLDTAQLQLMFFCSEREQPIRVSPARLRQMLFYVLQAVQGCSEPGDSVQIEIQASEGHLALRVQHAQSNSDPTSGSKASNSAMVDRALALTNAIVSNAGGDFSGRANPFLIVADFPMKPERRAGAIDKNKLSEFASPLAVSSRRCLKTS